MVLARQVSEICNLSSNSWMVHRFEVSFQNTNVGHWKTIFESGGRTTAFLTVVTEPFPSRLFSDGQFKKLGPFGFCKSERQEIGIYAELFFWFNSFFPFSQSKQYNLKEEQSFSLGKCSSVG